MELFITQLNLVLLKAVPPANIIVEDYLEPPVPHTFSNAFAYLWLALLLALLLLYYEFSKPRTTTIEEIVDMYSVQDKVLGSSTEMGGDDVFGNIISVTLTTVRVFFKDWFSKGKAFTKRTAKIWQDNK